MKVANSRYKTEAALENSRRSSREAKRRRTGTCSICGGVTRYNGTAGNNGPSFVCHSCSARRTARAQAGTGWVSQAILELLVHGPVRPVEIADELGISRNHVNQELLRMIKRGQIARASKGVYDHPGLCDMREARVQAVRLQNPRGEGKRL